MSSKSSALAIKVAEMIESGLLDDAVRYSGEELAFADDRWRRARNEGGPTAALPQLDELIDAGAVHADCLFRAGYHADVVTLGLTLLLMASVDGELTRPEAGPAALALCYLVLVALEAMDDKLRRAATGVPDGEAHAGNVISYVASILYRLYRDFRDSSGRWGGRAYEILSELIPAGVVQSPSIVVNGKAVDPARPVEAIADAIGRLRALGFSFAP